MSRFSPARTSAFRKSASSILRICRWSWHEHSHDSNPRRQAFQVAEPGAGQGVSINHHIDELATVALAECDTETRFRAMAARGSKGTGLALWAKLTGCSGESYEYFFRQAARSAASRSRTLTNCGLLY